MEAKENLYDLSGKIGLPQRRRGVFEIRKAEGEKRKNLSVSAVKQPFVL